MHKGIEIRNRKRLKAAKKRNTVKPEQANLCQFVETEWIKIEKLNGKYRPMGKEMGKGLQVKDRLYLLNGHYKLVNSKGVRITRRYDNMPEWANEILLIRYKKETSAWVNT